MTAVPRLRKTRNISCSTIARFAEWLFELLTPVGIPDRVIAYLGDMVSLYVGAYAFEESLGVASPTGEELSPDYVAKLVPAEIDKFRKLLAENK